MKKSFFFLIVSVTSCNYAQTTVVIGPNWTIADVNPNIVLNFLTEITCMLYGYLWTTERIEKNCLGIQPMKSI